MPAAHAYVQELPAPTTTAGPTSDQAPCALQRHYVKSWNLGPHPTNYTPCAPFTAISPDVLTVLSGRAFGGNDPASVVALNDGSAIVNANNGLYRIDRGSRVAGLWGPEPEHQRDYYELNLVAPYSQGFLLLHSGSPDWLMGVRPDGTVAFRQAGTFAAGPPNDIAQTTAAQDPSGVIWLDASGNAKHTLYVLYPGGPRLERVPGDFYGLFGDAHGNIYANGADGLYQLRIDSSIQSRFLHANIPFPLRLRGQFGMDSYGDRAPPRAVGPDGSLWTSTMTQVIHVHTDGTTCVMRLHQPYTLGMHPIPNIPLRMAPDGSIWIQGYHEFVRITNGDRVQAIDAPWRPDEDEYDVIYSFAPDSSVWYVQTLKPNVTSVLHIRVDER